LPICCPKSLSKPIASRSALGARCMYLSGRTCNAASTSTAFFAHDARRAAPSYS